MFRLVRVEGIPKENLLWLKFHLRGGPAMKFLPLDFMTHPRGTEEVHFPWLWKSQSSLPLDGFAIYGPSTPEDEDEILLHIWANEGLPHPKVVGDWNVETARKWLTDRQRMFSDQSQMLISATTNQELYQLADYAATLDVKRLYMHTDTWRGEYWPNQFGFLRLNPQVFPNGEADFLTFSDYARSKGMEITMWSSLAIPTRKSRPFAAASGGLCRNSAAAHPMGTGVVGLIRPYGQVFTADNNSTLVEELGTSGHQQQLRRHADAVPV